jgi:molybdate transport system substrate-binding protein
LSQVRNPGLQLANAFGVKFLLRNLVSLVHVLILAILFTTACRHSESPSTANHQLTVAAASDLIPAFEEIGREFQSATGTRVVFDFGSTGLLTRQIENGAPMDLFAAANVDYINELELKGLIVDGTKAIYARGRIVIWTATNSKLQFETLKDLTNPEVHRIAIANPDHAPYGRAARQALENSGIWENVKPKLVYGENIRQTLQFAQTGNVEVAIVALSLAQQSDGHWTLIPDTLHRPLDQALAVIKGTQNEKQAREFAAFVTGTQGRGVLQKYGFTFPK